MPLRLLTYLSPGLPFGLYAAIGDYLARRLDEEVSVAAAPEGSGSGPGRNEPNPFVTGEADLGFVCAPSYQWMARAADPPVELLGAAPCHDDPRAQGRPVYFAEVVAHRELALTCFEDLAGKRVVFNDPTSLSGYHCLLGALAARNLQAEQFFRSFEASGSHHRSLELIAAREADAAAIDGNTLGGAHHAQLSTVCTLGPFPIQPIVIRRGLKRMRPIIRDALLEMHLSPDGDKLRRFGVERFAPVSDEDYATPLAHT